jgi:hypothetical protein
MFLCLWLLYLIFPVGTSPQMQNGPFRAVPRWSVSPPLQQALPASQSQTGSPSMARNKRRHFQPKSCIPVFRIQRSVSRFNVLRSFTLGSRAASATRPDSNIYTSHPAERSAASTSTHCSATQSCPRLSIAQPAPRNWLTLYIARRSLRCSSGVRFVARAMSAGAH